MGSRPPRTATRLPLLVCLGLIAIWGILGLIDWVRDRQSKIFREEVLHPLEASHRNGEGWWVGDITENYRLGKISRQLAEADTAPLNPLVPNPLPFHGYYVRIMDSGPPNGDGESPISFKGMKRCRDGFAIMIYPAEPGAGKNTFIYSSGGTYYRSDAWIPTFGWPTTSLRREWYIVD